MDGAGDAVLVSLPEKAGDKDSRTHEEALVEAYHHEYEGPGRADGGEAIGAEVTAHDEAVCGVVKLLENLAEHHRHGEFQQKNKRIPHGKVEGIGMYAV